jgi:5'-nucleotidase
MRILVSNDDGIYSPGATWHSGTLAAAKQAVLHRVRGIAFSTPADEEEPDFDKLQPHVEEILQSAIREPSPLLLNVNIPPDSRGILWTRQSLRRYDGKMVRDTDPMGREHFWFTVVPIDQSEEGTDRWAVETGRTSITPLRLDLTDERELKKVDAENFWKTSGQTEFPARPRMTR